MNRQQTVLFRGGVMAVLVLSLCGGAAPAQETPGVQQAARKRPVDESSAALDRMIAAGKSQHELAKYVFDNHGCKECHTIGSEGKLGFTAKGKERTQGFEGCISTLIYRQGAWRISAGPRSGEGLSASRMPPVTNSLQVRWS